MGYIVLVSADTVDMDNCLSHYQLGGNYFHEPTSRCFDLVKLNHGGDVPIALEADAWPTAESYGLDKEEFFTNAYGCAESYPDGVAHLDSNWEAFPTDGSLPECFYNFPLVQGQTYGPVSSGGPYYTAYLWDITLNTAGAWENDVRVSDDPGHEMQW
jgi:hypothetical protein